MKLLLATDSFAPLIGGATRAAELLALELLERGHEVAVVTIAQPGTAAMEVRDGIPVHRIKGLTSRLGWLSADPFRRGPPPFPDPEMTWRVRRLVKKTAPDVVHAYGWLTYSCAAALLGTQVPLLVSARDYGNTCALRTLVRDGEVCSGPAWSKCLSCAGRFYGQPKGVIAVAGVLGGRRLLRLRMDGLHSVSRFVREHDRRFLLHTDSASERPIEAVLPDFSASERSRSPNAAILALLPSNPYILYVGALRKVKGIELLLRAYSQLNHPPPLVVIGTRTPDTPSFPEHVTVLNDVPHETVLAAWERALFGVAPSILPEPFGNVVHEAMSRGRPVIGTYPGGHEEMIVDGKNGLLVPSGNEMALVGAMQSLLDDSGLRERMGRAALEVAPRFAAQAVMPAFDTLYARVASKRGEPASEPGVRR